MAPRQGDPARGHGRTGDSLVANVVASGAVSSGIVLATNPLDCLRVRWQVQPEAQVQHGGLWLYARRIVAQEGLWNGLWRPGLGANVLAVFNCTGIRIGVYPHIRDALLGLQGTTERNPSTMAVSGLCAGAISFFVATPFFQAKTRLQAEAGLVDPATGLLVTGVRAGRPPAYAGALDFFAKCARHEGLSALLRGCSALVVRGSLLSMGHLSGYDYTKTTLKKHGLAKEGPTLHVGASVVAALLGVTASCPADRVMTEFQSAPNRGLRYSGVLDCASAIARSEGPAGFMRGWWPLFLRIAPTFATFGALYEIARKVMGMDYF